MPIWPVGLQSAGGFLWLVVALLETTFVCKQMIAAKQQKTDHYYFDEEAMEKAVADEEAVAVHVKGTYVVYNGAQQ